MSSPSQMSRRLFVLGAFAALPIVSGCSMSPVYGSGAVPDNLRFYYPEPTDRTEQIIFQDLRSKLGQSDDPNGPRMIIVKGANSSQISSGSNGSVFTTRRAAINALVRIITGTGNNTQRLFEKTLTGSALYEESGQIVADRAALRDAEERAAHALAETIRLALMAHFANQG